MTINYSRLYSEYYGQFSKGPYAKWLTLDELIEGQQGELDNEETTDWNGPSWDKFADEHMDDEYPCPNDDDYKGEGYLFDDYFALIEAVVYGSGEDLMWFMVKKKAYESQMRGLDVPWPTDADYKEDVKTKPYKWEDVDIEGNYNMPLITMPITGEVLGRLGADDRPKPKLPNPKDVAKLAFKNHLSILDTLDILGVEVDSNMDEYRNVCEGRLTKLVIKATNPAGFEDVRAKGTRRVKVNKHWKFSNTSEVGFGETTKLEPSSTASFGRGELQTRRKDKYLSDRGHTYPIRGGRLSKTRFINTTRELVTAGLNDMEYGPSVNGKFDEVVSSLEHTAKLLAVKPVKGAKKVRPEDENSVKYQLRAQVMARLEELKIYGKEEVEGNVTEQEAILRQQDVEKENSMSWSTGYTLPNGFVDPRANYMDKEEWAANQQALERQRNEIANYLKARNFGSERRQARRTGAGTVFR